jgi:high affinity Mn2+ porin
MIHHVRLIIRNGASRHRALVVLFTSVLAALTAAGENAASLSLANAAEMQIADTLPASDARADEGAGSEGGMAEWWSVHGQFTNVTQFHPRFPSPFRGPKSLDPGNRGNETIDATLFLGIRIWDGLEFYADPEINQGFLLSNGTGVAGFVNGEGAKVGAASPYARLPRAFFRYTVGVGGSVDAIEPEANQLAGTRPADNLIFTVGKFAVPDIFDTNTYAHDARADFLNWALVDSGAYDYASDAWGYTYGGAVEWTQSWWTLRVGLFDLSRMPGSKALERGFGQYEVVTEVEERHAIRDQAGKIKLLVFANRGRMANYNDAVRLAQQTGTTPDVAQVRHYATRPGLALNLEQQIIADLGAFMRASLNDGHKEAFEFTDIDRSIAAGVSTKGERWHRPNDTVGFAGIVNNISKDARNYLAAGGLGLIIGDGQLPRAGLEKIVELYYRAALTRDIHLTVDYQHVANPGYDAVRGPVDIIGFRVHAEF